MKEINRRAFLRTMGAVGLGAAAFMALPGCA